MNTHNVNVNTATPESPKTWAEKLNTSGLPVFLSDDVKFLISLCDGSMRMLEEERLELIDGYAHRIAEGVCDAAANWSEPRPRIPAAVVAAWLLVRDAILSFGGEWGESLWEEVVRKLKNMLIVERAHP